MLIPEQVATILAALRYYQQCGLGEPDNRPMEIHEIATDGGDLISLNDQGIDELCTILNEPEPDSLSIALRIFMDRARSATEYLSRRVHSSPARHHLAELDKARISLERSDAMPAPTDTPAAAIRRLIDFKADDRMMCAYLDSADPDHQQAVNELTRICTTLAHGRRR